MDILKIIESRHSVRQYLDNPIEAEKKSELIALANSLNARYDCHAQLLFDDEAFFKNAKASYGLFSGCKNCVALVGKSAEDCGYVGELISLKAQELGLNTCFVGLTYKKGEVKKRIKIEKGEKLQCAIALGYGKTQGFNRKSKTEDQILDIIGERPKILDDVVKACLLAPTAMNQQKFKIVCRDGDIKIEKHGIGFYLDVDLGIVKAHKDLVLGKISL